MFQRGPCFLHLKDVFREAEYAQSFLLRCLYHLRGGTRNYVAVEICNDRHEIYAPQRSGVYGSNLPLRKRYAKLPDVEGAAGAVKDEFGEQLCGRWRGHE